MPVNDYFNFTTPLSPHTLGRETAINDLFTAVQAGFALIPSTSAFTNNLNGYYVDNSVAANAILLTPNPILGAYTEGAMVRWKQKIANTGACTLNISSLGPINLKRNDGSALIAGDIPIDSMPVAIIGAAGAIAYLVSSSAIDVTSAAASAAAAAASATSASTSASSAATSLAACNALFAITATPQFAKLGLGMVAVNILDITQTQNAVSLANILNANGGNSAGAGWSASNNGGHSVVLRMHGTATTTAGLTVQNGGLIRASAGATGGLALDAGGGSLLFGVANAEVARINATGLGIGMTPVNPLDISYSFAGNAYGRLWNSSGNVAALAGWQLKNSANSLGGMSLLGGSYTASGMYQPDRLVIDASGTGGIGLNTTVGSTGIFFGINGTEVARVTGAGFQINTTSRSETLAVVGFNSSNAVFDVFNNAAAASLLFTGPGNLTVSTGASAANACLYVNKDSTTSRSINAAGTVNASGADYAEYERKAKDCGDISKGQIIGFDADGCVTDKWAAVASRFGVKSTDPSYVGGDKWGAEDALGMVRPVAPIQPDAKSGAQAKAKFAADMTAHETSTAVFAAKIEVARQTVDRIAYAGKCHCNVMGASVGDYIIAIEDGSGGITGKPAISPDFDEYRRAVGRVVALLPDGRCNVAVMVH